MAQAKAGTKETGVSRSWQEAIEKGDKAYGNGNLSEAESSYRAALAEAEKLEMSDPRLVTSLSTLAWFYRDQGRYGEAEPLFCRISSYWEKMLGQEHPSVAASLHKLAEFYFVQGRYGEALPLYERALSLKETILGRRSLDLADTVEHLAAVHLAEARYQAALELFEKALEIRQAALGNKHPAVALSQLHLASVYLCQGKTGEAAMMAASAKRIGSEKSRKIAETS